MFAVAGFAPLQIIFFIRLKQYSEQSVRRNWNRDQAACDTDQKHRTQGVSKNFEYAIHIHASFGRRITTLAYPVAGVKRLAVLPRCLAVLWPSGFRPRGFRFTLPFFPVPVSRSELCSALASAGVHFMNSLRHLY